MMQKLAFTARILAAIVLAIGVLLSTGCGRSSPFDTTWAANSYPSKTSSPNGLGFLEKLCGQKGARFKTVSRLSPRLDRADCLILLGNTMHPPAKEARDWMEEWLAEKSGRKVIYFGRDFDAAEFYMQQTLDQHPNEKRRRAGIDLAQARATRDDLLYEQMNGDHFCRWFFVRVSKPERVLEKFSGPWSQSLSGQMKWPVRSYLDIPDQNLRDDQPDWTVATKPPVPFRFPRPFRTNRPPPAPRPAPKPTPAQSPDVNRNVFTSFWVPDDIKDAEEWEREWELAPNAEPLLVGNDGTPLITRLTSDRYEGSEIITLANGAPLFNGMMVDADLRALCVRIANEIGADARVAWLPYDQSGIQVSRVPDMDDEVAGLSVLMTWPLNILMAHLAFMGVLICVALFPILGRPQNLKASNVSDFGQHAEALGQLLQATNDLPFALRLVGEYSRVVRDESAPVWVESELAKLGASPSPPPPTLLPLPSPGGSTG